MTSTATPPLRIFVLDDHPLLRMSVKDVLSKHEDLQMLEDTGSSSEATTAIKALRPDIAIIDVTLEEGSGLDLIRTLRQDGEIRKTTQFLVFSSHRDDMVIHQAREVGAAGFVNKSAPPEVLVNALHTIADGGSWGFESLGTPHSTAAAGPAQLSVREQEIFKLLGEGLTTKEMAQKLNRSVKTVEAHKENIKNKLGLRSAAELLRHAVIWSLRDT